MAFTSQFCFRTGDWEVPINLGRNEINRTYQALIYADNIK